MLGKKVKMEGGSQLAVDSFYKPRRTNLIEHSLTFLNGVHAVAFKKFTLGKTLK